MTAHPPHDRALLIRLAETAMVERGLWPEFGPKVAQQLADTHGPATPPTSARDDTARPWCSIDNDDSRDIDQLTVAERDGNAVHIAIAVADVQSTVAIDSAIDRHAAHNTTSVYTGARTFSMLPEQLSTDWTSLNLDQDRLALVVEATVTEDGRVHDGAIAHAVVRNRAKLAYPSVGAWLEGKAPPPAPLERSKELQDNLRLQDQVAGWLADRRARNGELELETREVRPGFDSDRLAALEVRHTNRASALIESFMIAANGVVARRLQKLGVPFLQRVVREPDRWMRIVDFAAERGTALPPQPDNGALRKFLVAERARDPLRFSDLSLTIVKLLGRGEYVVERPGQAGIGHFGLALRDYVHATAPNRRFPDLVAQRVLLAAEAGEKAPYSTARLGAIAEQCTHQEEMADKVERRLLKSAGALLLRERVGERFEAIVTGVNPHGVWVRCLQPPVEGMVVKGGKGMRVGNRVAVELVSVDVEQGYVDFEKG